MYSKVPSELKKIDNWVCWKLVKTAGSKPRKIPIDAKTGGPAKSNDPSTWCSFDVAVKASVNYSGIGFQFSNSPFFGVDIDGIEPEIEDYKHGINDNVVGEFVHSLKSYAEYSISGTGLHIICKGSLPEGGRRRGKYEFYETGRYFIVSGDACSPYTTISDCTKSILPLHTKYIGKPSGAAPTTGIKPMLPLNLSDAEIIKLAEQSKQGTMFSDLWAGNYSSYHNSQSEADLALCNILAFWTRKDEQLMDKLFRQSGLMRDKWDRKQGSSTYGQVTVKKAARDCGAVYEKQPEYQIHIGTKAPSEEARQPYKRYTFTDTGNAQRFRDRFEQSMLHNYTSKSWMYYDTLRWVQDCTGEAKRMADEVAEEYRGSMQGYLDNLLMGEDSDDAIKAYQANLKTMLSSRGKSNMLTEAAHMMAIEAKDFDNHAHKFNVLNGTLNLTTGTLHDHNKDDMISKIATCEYTDKCDTPRWDAFLDDIFSGDKELIRYIQKAIGYSLTGSTEEHCAFFCYGTGRNGKSTLLDIVSDMMGDYAINIQPETIMVRQAQSGPTSDIARLKGARFVTTVEPNEGTRLNEGLLKQMTGGDKVTASKKFENEFEFWPEFKLWMGTNHKPVIRGTDVGIWSRIHLIPFNVQIPDEKIDRHLKDKLREEMPGIMAWAVEGCLMWRKEGLKRPAAVADASKEYKGEMDVLAAFMDTCCEDGGETEAGELFKAYIEWAKEGNEYEMSSTKFGREMSKRYEKRRSNRGNFYSGISIIPAEKPSGFKVHY